MTLDLGLPGIDGIEACRRIREISDAYVVMITARDDEIDRLLGLETGADDFIAKPFSARELKARVNAMFRRPRTTDGAPVPVEAYVPGPRRTRSRARLAPGGRRRPAGLPRRGGARAHPHRVRPAHRADAHPCPGRTRSGAAAVGLGHRVGVGHPPGRGPIGNLRRKLGEVRGGPRYIRTVRGGLPHGAGRGVPSRFGPFQAAR